MAIFSCGHGAPSESIQVLEKESQPIHPIQELAEFVPHTMSRICG